MLVLTCKCQNRIAVADPTAGWDKGYRVIKQLTTSVQARTGYKEFTSFPCARFDPYLVYYVYMNKLGRVSLYNSLILALFFLAALNQCFASDKGTEFITHPPT